MSMILALDPGNEQTAFCLLYNAMPVQWATIANHQLANDIRMKRWPPEGVTLAVEMIASYGMPVGREVFETCVWIGRFIEAWQTIGGSTARFVYRKDVKMHLCNTMKAKDANVRQALIDLYGPGKDKAIGKKGAPGPLYNVHGDEWSALAVAVTAGHVSASTMPQASLLGVAA